MSIVFARAIEWLAGKIIVNNNLPRFHDISFGNCAFFLVIVFKGNPSARFNVKALVCPSLGHCLSLFFFFFYTLMFF